MVTIKFIGNLGNKLFQLWSLHGIGAIEKIRVHFPEDEMYEHFEGNFSPLVFEEEQILYKEFKETTFEYNPPYIRSTPGFLNDEDKIGLKGFYQSEKYWLPVEKELRKMFTFKKKFAKQTNDKLPKNFFDKEVICISVRRGDFVNNPVYYQLPAMYYIGALLTHFSEFETRYNILILSDDLEYCKVHFGCLSNVFFADGLTALEQLYLGSQADYHIISNSTFSWWCAYLSKNKKVIRPKHNFGDAYRATHPEYDFWPETKNWITFDHEGYKIPLKDTTFMIPVYFDYPDRKGNLDLSVCMLQRDFDTNIMVMENKGNKFAYMHQWCQYEAVQYTYFHRTKMLNEMALKAQTPYIVNWDADVVVPPLQLLASVRVLRGSRAHFVYPYDGRFVRVLRRPYFSILSKALDVGVFRNQEYFTNGHVKGKEMAVSSVGGAVVMNRAAFIHAGLENEHMVSYAPEDCERWDRWHMLKFVVCRVKGKLFHIDHFCGPDSCSLNPFFTKNHAELDRIRNMSLDELWEYVNGWPWRTRAMTIHEKEKQVPVHTSV